MQTAGGYLSAGCARRWRTDGQSSLFTTIDTGCSVRIGLGRNQEGQLRALCYQYGGESESGLKPMGSPDNWRCIALEKLRAWNCWTASWQTAPNHSRPASCIVEADVDAEDLSGARSTAGTVRKQPDQVAGNDRF